MIFKIIYFLNFLILIRYLIIHFKIEYMLTGCTKEGKHTGSVNELGIVMGHSYSILDA